MIVEWFTPSPRPELEWFGLLSGTLASMGGGGTVAVASVVGPPGAQGQPGTSSLTIDPQAGNLLTTSSAGLFVNGALDLGTFN